MNEEWRREGPNDPSPHSSGRGEYAHVHVLTTVAAKSADVLTLAQVVVDELKTASTLHIPARPSGMRRFVRRIAGRMQQLEPVKELAIRSQVMSKVGGSGTTHALVHFCSDLDGLQQAEAALRGVRSIRGAIEAIEERSAEVSMLLFQVDVPLHVPAHLGFAVATARAVRADEQDRIMSSPSDMSDQSENTAERPTTTLRPLAGNDRTTMSVAFFDSMSEIAEFDSLTERSNPRADAVHLQGDATQDAPPRRSIWRLHAPSAEWTVTVLWSSPVL